MGHIELAQWADLVLIAPATANTISRLAAGAASDLLTTLCLATRAPIFFAPAMNEAMYNAPFTVRNLKTLRESTQFSQIGPDSGEQACGSVGPGRMVEPDDIVRHLQAETQLPLGSQDAFWRTKTVMITAGPTREHLDPVRYITNHSSGKQGLALAAAARDRGAHIILICGPGVAALGGTINCVERIDVETACEMDLAVQSRLTKTDIFIGVAAVADYRAQSQSEQKIKKTGSSPGLSLELVENPDIIQRVASAGDSRPPLVIGFAAESHDPIAHATGKLKRKNLDAIILNDISNNEIGFNTDENEVTFISASCEHVFERQSKQALSNQLLDHISSQFG